MSLAITEPQLATAEDLPELSAVDREYEIIEGVLVEVPPWRL